MSDESTYGPVCEICGRFGGGTLFNMFPKDGSKFGEHCIDCEGEDTDAD